MHNIFLELYRFRKDLIIKKYTSQFILKLLPYYLKEKLCTKVV